MFKCTVIARAEPDSGAEGRRFASTPEKVKHCGTGIYSDGSKGWVDGNKSCEKAAISVAEHQCVTTVEKKREKVQAAAFEGAAQRKVFKPAVRTGYGIEVRL